MSMKLTKIDLKFWGIMLNLILIVLFLIVARARGSLDFSAPVYTIRYRGHHVNIFQSAPNVTSEAFYYYTPSCRLLPNVTKALGQDGTGPHFITLKLALWDDDYIQHIRTFIAQRTGHENPLLRPVSFNWMRIDSINNIPSNLRWKTIANHPTTVSFRIRCATIQECNDLDESVRTDSEHFASNMELAFAYRAPQKTRQTITIELDHLQASPTFSAVKEHFPDTKYVFVQKSVFSDIVQETVTKSIESSLGNDEFIDDDQLDSLSKQAARIMKLRHNVTSTAEFTEVMWESTYWHDEDERPDLKAKHLETLFSSGMNLLERVLNMGDNATVTGFFGTSRAVTDAIAELKRSDGPVRWTGKRIVVAPIKLCCINLVRPQQQFFGNLSVQATKKAADYYTSVHSLTSTNTAHLQKRGNGNSSDQQQQFNETVKALFEEYLQSMKFINEEKFHQNINRTTKSIITLENQLCDVGNRITQSIVTLDDRLADVGNRTAQAFVSLENRLSDVGNRTERLETNLVQFNGMVTNFTEQLRLQTLSESHSDPQNDTFQLIKWRLQVLERNTEETKANATELIESCATVLGTSVRNNSTLETHIRAIDTLRRNITLLEQSLEVFRDKAESITNSANSTVSSVSLLGSRINVLEQTCELSNQKVMTLTSKATELSDQMQTVARQSQNAVSAASQCHSDISKLEMAAIPIGSIVAFPVYSGFGSCWLECTGQSFSSTIYPKLYNALGRSYVPNLSGRFLLGRSSRYSIGATGGEETHTLTVSEMPSHQHAPLHGGNFMDMDGKFHIRKYATPQLGHTSSRSKLDTQGSFASRMADLLNELDLGVAAYASIAKFQKALDDVEWKEMDWIKENVYANYLISVH